MSLDIDNTCDYCLGKRFITVYRIAFLPSLSRLVVPLRMCKMHYKECFIPHTDFEDEAEARIELTTRLLCNE
jgi:hypothetical protein